MSETGKDFANDYIFSTTDPLGREVKLKSTTWHMHITGGDHQRTQFIGQEEVIKSIIKDPYIILPNNIEDEEDTRQKYVELAHLPGFNSLKAVVVVVDHKDETSGDVVTVMPKSSLKSEKTGGAIYVRSKATGIE
ncbi:hypothetical protein [Bacillus subtilis]|uniref:hypothetical protein n=1 Tax=Bacillus subtilis TaxID=1423 RepID=UPI00138963DA|nr:hypothetical protein [Bacillus subtilis]